MRRWEDKEYLTGGGGCNGWGGGGRVLPLKVEWLTDTQNYNTVEKTKIIGSKLVVPFHTEISQVKCYIGFLCTY
jgi:hypothetical protein